MKRLLPTTLVGSYPQPDWLMDRARLADRFPPRVRARELWRVDEPWLQQVLFLREQDELDKNRLTNHVSH